MARKANPNACIYCRYDLADMPDDVACPECGRPTALSREGYMLRQAPRNHVRALSRGCLVIEIAMIASLAMSLIQQAWTGGLSNRETIWSEVAFYVLTIMFVFAEAVGWFRLLRLDPRYAGQDPTPRLRLIARISVAANATAISVVVLISLAFNLFFLWNMADLSASSLMFGLQISFLLMVLTIAVRFFALVLWLRILATRLDSRRLIAWTGVLFWLGPVAAFAFAGVDFLDLAVPVEHAWLSMLLRPAVSLAWLICWAGAVEAVRRGLIRIARAST